MDRENAFLLYATFCGDVEKTAHALNIAPADVLAVVEAEKWNEKLRSIIELKKSARPGDLERAINRALNFVQAHSLRLFVERVIRRLSGMSEEEMEGYIFTKSGGINKKTGEEMSMKGLSTRAIADLASAMEKAHSLTYHALNDTAPERARRDTPDDDGGNTSDLSVRIAAAMSRVREGKSTRAHLLDAQLKAAQGIVDNSTNPSKPVE
jgi:hypothetical protein